MISTILILMTLTSAGLTGAGIPIDSSLLSHWNDEFCYDLNMIRLLIAKDVTGEDDFEEKMVVFTDSCDLRFMSLCSGSSGFQIFKDCALSKTYILKRKIWSDYYISERSPFGGGIKSIWVISLERSMGYVLVESLHQVTDAKIRVIERASMQYLLINGMLENSYKGARDVCAGVH